MEERLKKKLWDKNRKKFIEEFSILYTENENTYFERDSETKELALLSTCHIEEISCTGLMDNNKKLIYEGDIVIPSGGFKGVVKWLDQDACFAVVYRDNSIQKLGMSMLSDEFTIIGNVNEIKELICKE